jgi:methyltransferase (TIGR00027 family)
MSQSKPVVEHVSDTARWAAVYRADENDRPDALFRDPFARRLAGERGEQIAAALPFHQQNSWSWVARTYLYDRLLTEQLREGVDLVVNLAAGLDTRPYRMELPAPLVWVEVDLPGILDYKEQILGAAKPACVLEHVRQDLTDAAARRALFSAVGARGTKGLIITEGLLVYLGAEAVGTLAEDLAGVRSFERWLLDIPSPGLLQMLKQNTNPQLSQGGAELKFAPEDGPQFFTRHGWNPIAVESLLKTAAALKRLPKEMEPLALLPEDPAQMGSRPWSAACLMGR